MADQNISGEINIKTIDVNLTKEQAITSIGETALNVRLALLTDPSTESIAQWSAFAASAIGQFEEGVVDLTQELWDSYPDEMLIALDKLSVADRISVESIISGKPNVRDIELRSSAPTRPSQILASFSGERFLRKKKPIIQGTLTVYDVEGKIIGKYTANTGRVGESYRNYGGPIPPGSYSIGTYVPNINNSAMTRNGVRYAFTLSRRPGTNNYGRSGFCIHPDGGVLGTLGCIGVFENAEALKACEKQLVAGIVYSKYITVDYSNIERSLFELGDDIDEGDVPELEIEEEYFDYDILRASFPDEVISAAQSSQVEWRVPASVTLAQWALESGYGKSMPEGSNNPFGIKGNSKNGVLAPTIEQDARTKKKYKVMAWFRIFDSLEEAFSYHGQLLATNRAYRKAMRYVDNPDAFVDKLQGVYATDINYASQIKDIMRRNNLYKYDR